MSKKLNALLDTLDDVKNPKEKVGVLHVNKVAWGGGPSSWRPSFHNGPNWDDRTVEHLVAYVEVDKNWSVNKKLEKVFMKTNSITDAWWNNKEVTKMFSGKACRSTSIGDIVIIGTNKYKCESTGWSKTAWKKPLHEWKEIGVMDSASLRRAYNELCK
ncbi:MAG: hypothetical protein CMO16_07475 [Thaumarchaeota archaeon]|nr:hypothetical protein [Nitrososphaerota archaeon]